MIILWSVFLFLPLSGFAAERHFGLFKKETKEGPTLLIIGGIHGDEPGGFFAPMLFSKHYTIQKGGVWVVPNLNFDSIVRNRRGVYGDMNRKFAHIDTEDEDYQIVSDIKGLILSPEVNMVLNLHDGHGFYREETIDALFNPKAWGQTCIIDQELLSGVRFGNLGEIAKRVSLEANVLLREDVHEFNVKNTHTKEMDEAMRQSLTYFAIKNRKPAFAVETSKNITDLALKVFYQLKTIEEFMDVMGIVYQKDFSLDVETIRRLLMDYGTIQIPKGRIAFKLSDLRDCLHYFPINREGLKYNSDNPLIALIKEGLRYRIVNGNMPVTTLSYELYDFDESLKYADFIIDGSRKTVGMGSTVSVKNAFEVVSLDGYRVNIIGFVREGLENETGTRVERKDIASRFSIDEGEHSFRVEFYRRKKFGGMVIVEFQISK